jgi:hypothetical protein
MGRPTDAGSARDDDYHASPEGNPTVSQESTVAIGARVTEGARLTDTSTRELLARFGVTMLAFVESLTEPRATVDFNFSVETSKLKSILHDLTSTFGRLDEQDIGAAVQLAAYRHRLDPLDEPPLFKEALRDVRVVGE